MVAMPTVEAMRQATVVTIGNSDGVHRGHQSLILSARRLAGAHGRVLAVAFDPHPATILRPDAVPERLTTRRSCHGLLKKHGADEVVFLTPDDRLLGMSPDEFIDQTIMPCGPSVLVEGPDFRFGAQRRGTAQTLRDLGSTRGFGVEIVDGFEVALADQSVVVASSTLLRWLLGHGRVADAERVLGWSYAVTGTVQRGAQRGRLIGIPTINVAIETMKPANGVYAGRARDSQGAWHGAAINVGVRPTFGGTEPTIEAHLIGWDGPGDEYDWATEIAFDRFLRDEVCFDGPEAVATQIRRDLERIGSGGAGTATAI